MNYTFITETDPDYAKKVYAVTAVIICVVLCALSCLALLVSVLLFIMLEALSIIVATVSAKRMLAANRHFNIKFEGKIMHVYGTTMSNEAHFDDLCRSDLVIKQNVKAESENCCDLTVKGKHYYGVKKAKELSEYIDRTF